MIAGNKSSFVIFTSACNSKDAEPPEVRSPPKTAICAAFKSVKAILAISRTFWGFASKTAIIVRANFSNPGRFKDSAKPINTSL